MLIIFILLHLNGRGKKSVASCDVTDGVKSSAEDCVSSSSPDKRSLAISSWNQKIHTSVAFIYERGNSGNHSNMNECK